MLLKLLKKLEMGEKVLFKIINKWSFVLDFINVIFIFFFSFFFCFFFHFFQNYYYSFFWNFEILFVYFYFFLYFFFYFLFIQNFEILKIWILFFWKFWKKKLNLFSFVWFKRSFYKRKKRCFCFYKTSKWPFIKII